MLVAHQRVKSTLQPLGVSNYSPPRSYSPSMHYPQAKSYSVGLPNKAMASRSHAHGRTFSQGASALHNPSGFVGYRN